MKTARINFPAATIPLVSFTLACSSFGQGALTPPGAPAPLFKTLDQVEPRTPISSLPYTITNSGSYYLTGSFVVAGGVALNIAADGVTLDLRGFTITSTNDPAGGFGIQISGTRRNIDIRNGHLQGGGTNIGGTFSGPGFLQGITFTGGGPQNVRVTGVNVSSCQTRGISLGAEYSTVVSQCTVRTVGTEGITAGIVSDSVVTDSNGSGINAKTVHNSIGSGGTGTGLIAETASNCKGTSHTGIGLNATNALNCTGSSSNNIGLNAGTAQNCTGISTNGIGLAAETANNCKGTATGFGIGLSADTANSCKGYSIFGFGLSATNAQNCLGVSGNGTGLFAARTATTCVGTTGVVGAPALQCDGTANACTGQNTSGGGTAIKAIIGIGCVKFGGTNNITSSFLGTVSP